VSFAAGIECSETVLVLGKLLIVPRCPGCRVSSMPRSIQRITQYHLEINGKTAPRLAKPVLAAHHSHREWARRHCGGDAMRQVWLRCARGRSLSREQQIVENAACSCDNNVLRMRRMGWSCQCRWTKEDMQKASSTGNQGPSMEYSIGPIEVNCRADEVFGQDRPCLW